MSNKITLQATKFTDLPSNEETFGYRVFDDYESDYLNTLDEPITDDFDLLKLAVVSSPDFFPKAYLEDCRIGIEINGNYYKYDQIKDII
jgi:hypothetical protein